MKIKYKCREISKLLEGSTRVLQAPFPASPMRAKRSTQEGLGEHRVGKNFVAMLTASKKRTTSLLLLPLFCILILVSCAGMNAETKQYVYDLHQYKQFVDALRSDTSSAVITLERTACFGTCPIYVIAIYENGRVVYRGHEYVRAKGIVYDQIPADTVKHLLKELITAGYFSLAEKYETKKDTLANGEIVETIVTDLPTTITSVKITGKFKVVQNYFGAPDWLRVLEKRIDEITNSVQWIEKNE